ncbi:hypothetical protein JXA02_03270 [candidate division KSB1 bacterium]|nr:hypothetical protein [candidate division KSB1 bacterium]RQW09625.1 MAG: hypothetical protein EH222_03640 [candidate division KSB1 bacterium]
MKSNQWDAKSCGVRMNRRGFLSACSACTALCAATPLTTIHCARADRTKKKTIRIIYALHAAVQPSPDWPNIGFDFKPEIQRINDTLRHECPEFTFTPLMASGPEEAERILMLDKDDDIDGYIVFQMNCWNRVVQTFATSGKPVLYADFQYGGSGGFLVYNATFIRSRTPNVGFVASSKMDDLVTAVKCFAKIHSADEFAALTTQMRMKNTRKAGHQKVKADELMMLAPQDCLARMRASKILAVRDQNAGPAEPIFNIPMEYVAFAEVNAAWEKADREEACVVAERWRKSAADVIDVPFETLETSAAFYLGMKEVLKKHSADAITINCLGGFYGGHIHAYPCLGFHELNNEGLVGACECDTRSTATMLAFSHLTKGRPGYISDPVIDTAKRQIIYAHCVAPSKVFGSEGPSNPFVIMTHSEDRQGASVRSLLPTGYMTTTLEILPDQQEILLHQGIAVDNDADDRACRTKLCVEPLGDIEKLFTLWDRWGWHRVTFYGDLREPVHALADHIGWRVVEHA